MFFVKNGYDTVASRYDHLYDRPLDRMEDELAAWWLARGGAFAGEVLDIGCGTGHVIHLSRLAGLPLPPERYMGTDPSEGMIGAARRRWYEDGFDRWIVQYAEETGFLPRNSFDAVTCTFESWNYMHHPTVLRHLKRVLRPHGSVHIIAAGPMAAIQRRPIREHVKRPAPFVARRQRRLMERAGFRIMELRGMTTPWADRFGTTEQRLRWESRHLPHWIQYWQMVRLWHA